MQLNVILSGLIASYLAISPCLTLHHGEQKTESDQVATTHSHSHDHGHDHNESSDESDDHCCQDLSSSIHAPLKQQPTSASLVAIVPTVDVVIPYVHTRLQTALSRDGPLYEQAREHAQTIVMLS